MSPALFASGELTGEVGSKLCAAAGAAEARPRSSRRRLAYVPPRAAASPVARTDTKAPGRRNSRGAQTGVMPAARNTGGAGNQVAGMSGQRRRGPGEAVQAEPAGSKVGDGRRIVQSVPAAERKPRKAAQKSDLEGAEAGGGADEADHQTESRLRTTRLRERSRPGRQCRRGRPNCRPRRHAEAAAPGSLDAVKPGSLRRSRRDAAPAWRVGSTSGLERWRMASRSAPRRWCRIDWARTRRTTPIHDAL